MVERCTQRRSTSGSSDAEPTSLDSSADTPDEVECARSDCIRHGGPSILMRCTVSRSFGVFLCS
jgi:hypothetical protein